MLMDIGTRMTWNIMGQRRRMNKKTAHKNRDRLRLMMTVEFKMHNISDNIFFFSSHRPYLTLQSQAVQATELIGE